MTPHSAYTPQVPRLFGDLLKDNVLLGLPDDPARLQHALHAAVLERDVDSLEHGLQTVVGPRGVRLSGGQVQRVAAARLGRNALGADGAERGEVEVGRELLAVAEGARRGPDGRGVGFYFED